MNEHTPAPWKWCGNDIEAEDCTQGDVMSPSVNCGPFCYGGMVEMGISEANARHIVRCVNAHDRLVEALKDFSELDQMSMENAIGFIEDNSQDLRELLKELESES